MLKNTKKKLFKKTNKSHKRNLNKTQQMKNRSLVVTVVLEGTVIMAV